MASKEIFSSLQQPKVETVLIGGELINLSGDGLAKVINDLRIDSYQNPSDISKAA